MSTCPSDDTLARLGHDLPDGTEWNAVAAHVQQCAKCVESLEKLLLHGTATATTSESVSLPADEKLPDIPGFEVEGELGRGGMGVVYRARETKLARTVALKIVSSGPMSGSRERKRWLSEARCLTKVSHPNIVQIHDADEADGWLYLVLEFVPGGSLKDRLSGPLPPRAAAELMSSVAAAMTEVHAAGLLHLDLKPSNVLLDSAPSAAWKDAAPKVADFGIARSLADLDTSSTTLTGPWGTPSYMAPEQMSADRTVLGPATDVYALGAILCELLTGRPPFLAASPIETFDQIRNATPASPRSLNPSVARDLDTICTRCLQKDSRRRYPSAEALADDLNRFLGGRPIKARPVSPVEHAWRWCVRQPTIAALALALSLTVVGSFLGLSALLVRSETLRSRAEANYLVASRSLDEIVRLLFGSRNELQIISSGHEAKRTLEVARSGEIELLKQSPPDIGGLKRLAVIDHYLASFHLHDKNPEEARSLIEESITSCEAYLARRPDDAEFQWQRVESAAWMTASLSGGESDPLYGEWNARALAMLDQLKPFNTAHVYGMSGLSRCHRYHADSLMRTTGDTHPARSDRARKELEEDLALFKSAPGAESIYPEIVLNEALTLAALGRWSGEFRPVRQPIQPQPAYVGMPDLERNLAELTARRIGWLPSMIRSPWLIPEELSDGAWLDRVISSIKTDAASFHLDHTRIPPIAWQLWCLAANESGWRRRVDRIGDARRLADRLVALADRLTESFPDRAASYMLLSEACVQEAKNAYRTGVRVDVWERRAFEAATQASMLEPDNEEAHGLLRQRQVRLKKLASNP